MEKSHSKIYLFKSVQYACLFLMVFLVSYINLLWITPFIVLIFAGIFITLHEYTKQISSEMGILKSFTQKSDRSTKPVVSSVLLPAGYAAILAFAVHFLLIVLKIL